MNTTPGTAYLALLLLSATISSYMAYAGFRAHERPGATSFAVLATALATWSATESVEFLTSDVVVAVAVRQVRFLAIAVIPVSLVVLAATYAGKERELNRWLFGLVCVVPATTWLLVVTNPVHGLVWTVEGFTAVGQFSVLEVHRGPWFWVNFAYTYGLLAVASYLFVRVAVRKYEPYRLQSTLILLGTGILWTANVIEMFGPWDLLFDITPLFFSLSGICIGVAVLRYQFLDLVPVARNNVVEVMREGVLVVDDQQRIVDVNPAACDILGQPQPELVGEPLASASPTAIADILSGEAADSTVAVTGRGTTRHYDVRVSSLDGSGEVLLLRDVTEQREQAARLEHQNERLDRFASVLSHDLRNPLNVAEGYLDLLDEEVDSEYLGKIDTALGRMDRIIEDALTLAREGRALDEFHDVDLADVATAAWENVVTGEASLTVETDRLIRGDPDRVQRVFENLFRNSVEHGVDESSPLAVTVGDLPDEPGFYVADDGPGIPTGERDCVFDFGYSRGDGTGLGLAIVAEIADAHGWDVSVTESEDGGARFEFRGTFGTG